MEKADGATAKTGAGASFIIGQSPCRVELHGCEGMQQQECARAVAQGCAEETRPPRETAAQSTRKANRFIRMSIPPRRRAAH